MAKKRVQRGFTLVELLVGLTVGLITLLVLTQLLQSFEGQKRTSTGGNDAQTNGAFALYMLDREIRMAGYGVFGPESMLCKNGINMYYDDPAGGGATVQNAASFVPIRIIDGGGSAPDSVLTMRSDAEFGAVPTSVIKPMPNTSAELETSSGAGLKGPDRKTNRPGDLFIMASKKGDKICSLLQMTQDPQTTGKVFKLQHNPGRDGPYNPSNPNTAFDDAPSYEVGDIVINMGNYPRRQYSVQLRCAQLVESDPLVIAEPDCNNSSPLVDQIVNLQAQYGIAPAGSSAVNQWVDATGAWANPSGEDISRVRAIRLAVVARNPQYEKNAADTGTPNTLTMWQNGPTIDVAEADRHYRYRVYETIIPLRNIIWSPS